MRFAIYSVLSIVLFSVPGPAQPAQPAQPQAVAPVITTRPAQNGAVLVSLASQTPSATIRYTIDGSAPGASSQIYFAPFLVAANLTLSADVTAAGSRDSAVARRLFTPGIPAGTLVWSDEFTATGPAQPDPAVWNYDLGKNCCGNNELETYCAWKSAVGPCDPANPSAWVGSDGLLHIQTRQTAPGVYTSARLKTQGLVSFQYGRIEARMKLPESQGMWPAFWLLGNNITKIKWPACGELDVMEHINGADPDRHGFDWVQGSIHGSKLDGGIQYHPAGFSAAAWHTYGMIWSRGEIKYYIDNPANVYATFTPATQAGVWPFDDGPEFVIINLAVGGDWPRSPDSTTVFPSEVQVDYVRVFTIG